MKSAIIWYSYSGNTKKVALQVASAVAARGDAASFTLQDLKETRSFFRQCSRAFRHAATTIQGAPLDVSGYTHLCIGTPVWAFAPAPPVTTFLQRCEGIAGKKILFFVTCGSGTGVAKCFAYMEDGLRKKGVTEFARLVIPQSRVSDSHFVDRAINTALAEWK